MRLRKGDKILKPVHPNAGIRAEYRRRLDDIVSAMSDSYEYWITAAYRANRPEMAQDTAPMRVTAVQGPIGANNNPWMAYVGGQPLRDARGVLRVYRSRDAAEAAGLRSAGWNTLLTEPIPLGARFSLEALETVPVVMTPAASLQGALDELGARWTAKIDEAAPKLGRWFAQAAGKRAQDGLQKVLRDGGLTVKFQMTPAMRDVMDATVAENVGLIKSIGQQYHTEVQGMVMRSVAAGRDVGGLTKDLQERYGITRRRAATIALSQNNLATSNFVKVKQIDAGLLATWLHSSAGKVPRRTHVANSGKVYDPAVGWHDPDPKVNKRIWPGQLIGCKCVSRPVVRGFS